MTRFDVGIVGLGAMGSMAALELARRGRRGVGFDRLHPPHVFGSSHGKSRIIREAYFEHPQYVPIVQRAYEQWTALEREGGRTLLVPTGGLMIGAPDGGVLAGARRGVWSGARGRWVGALGRAGARRGPGPQRGRSPQAGCEAPFRSSSPPRTR